MAFIAAQELFDEMADGVEEHSDMIAERAAARGGTAQGTVRVAAERAFLVPYGSGIAYEKEHIFTLSVSLGAPCQSARNATSEAATFGDADTADLTNEISRDVDRQLWFRESHLVAGARSPRD
jgi:starvation-inducible DNA-binding protein